jgi:hypothetical protein
MGKEFRFLLAFGILTAYLACWAPVAAAGSDVAGPIGALTMEPTLNPVTLPPTEPTFEPVTLPTTEVTITIKPTSAGGGKGWIDTYCNIDGATVSFDGKSQGKTAGGVLSVAVSPTGTPVKTVTVSKSGYVSWSGPLSHMPADGEHVAVYATLNPVPTTATTPVPPQNGAIYAQSTPGGAAIYVNGIFYGYSPITIPNLQPNSYSVKAVLTGYTTDSRTVTVYAGQTTPYYPQLQPSPPPPRDTGTIIIKSNPSGAAVYVDGDYRGVSPLTLSLYTGTHTLVIRLSGYNDWSTTVSVSAGSSQTVSPTLSPATNGMLTIGGAPAGAQVFVDSTLKGVTDAGGSFTMNSIPSGNHIIKVTATGYNDWIETVYVKPNTNNYIPVAMTPSGTTPPAGAGTLTIASSPAGAEVLVDNIFRGYTPLTLNDVDAGQHTVTLQLAGYQDYVTTASVSTGQSTPLAVTMNPAPTPTPASGMPIVIPVAGILAVCIISGIIWRRP